MLKKIQIKNFKSILNDTISLGKVNVFIGENGSGKSNILEALMFASIAETYETIDADILYTNGFRVSKPSLILSSFKGKSQKRKVEINLDFTDKNITCKLKPEDINNIFSKWNKELSLEDDSNKFLNTKFQEYLNLSAEYKDKVISEVEKSLKEKFQSLNEEKNEFKKSQSYTDLNNFIIYTLNTEALRGIPEFQKSRKGIYGETLDIIINELNNEEHEELKNYLYTFSWLDDFFIDAKDELKQKGYKLNHSKSLLYFRDKYMMVKNNVFSSENSNEGILHILFYLATIISSKSPNLFAIDNIETSLNPHLCRHTMSEICKLTKKHDKQILLTTHNPAILDGLNLFDDDIRLFEVFRTDKGDTRTRRIKLKPKVKDEEYKLSELWTRGYLGAISQKF
ncbi:MAG: AAA family ATPase [Bacteroidota bacterium]|nr:AAA family ATPase [Bacteroidota bacterium]